MPHPKETLMKALVIHGARNLTVEDVELPDPGGGEVRVRMRYAASAAPTSTTTAATATSGKVVGSLWLDN